MKIPPAIVFAAALSLAVCGRSAQGQNAPLFTANTTTATPETGAVHFLQLVNLSLNQGPGTYNISSITVSFNFTTTDTQTIRLEFYSGVDTNPNSASALASATLLAGAFSPITPPAAGNYAFIFNYTDPNNPLLLALPDTNAVGIEFALTNTSTGNYTTTANGRFTASAPTVGTADGYVWNDADLNNVFTGAEQTRFGMANANVRMTFSGVLVQPAPHIKSYARSGTSATLTADSYNGINYQLQRATSLTAGNWTNVGSVAAGSTGTTLTFTDADGTDPAAFYRITAALPAAASGSSQAVSRGVLPGPVGGGRRAPGGLVPMPAPLVVRDP